MRTIPLLAFAAVAALAACGGGGGSSTAPNPPSSAVPTPSVSQTITTGITANAALYQAVVAPDGRVWFTEFAGNQVAAVTTAGVVTEYALPLNSQPNGIAVGADGNIWTGGYGANIYRVTTAGSVTAYTLAGSHIGAMVLGPDSNVWFVDYGNKTVGNITTSGTITSYPVPAGSNPSGIARGADGNLWVADASGAILKVTTAGAFTKYTTGITAGGSPNAIIGASDGNLYFTEPFFSSSLNDRIGRVTTSGTITEIATLAPNTYPNQLANGKDGNVYFTEYSKSNLGKIALGTGSVTESPLGITGGTDGIVNGPDNLLWVSATQSVYRVSY